MPASNKTKNLKLNSWLGTDMPQRVDFVEDNTILDTVISEHLNDTTKHISEEDRDLLNNPVKIGVLSGDGTSSKSYNLSFNPRYVFVFLRNAPFTEYDSSKGYTICNSAVVASDGGGGTIGASLSENVLTLSQSITASNGRFINLNKGGAMYFYIAIK